MAGPPAISLGPWDGPLDLLLDAARRRRVDLARISLAALVDACLAALSDIESTREKVDAIAIAAELTLMKSRLLLPAAGDAETDEAARLRRRLEHLALIREAAAALLARDQLGQDVFARGAPERLAAFVRTESALDLLTLVRAYADIRLQGEPQAPLELKRILAMSVREARPLVDEAVAGGRGAWVELFAATGAADRRRGGSASKRSVAAASFAAALEMARRGEVIIRQDEGETIEIMAR